MNDIPGAALLSETNQAASTMNSIVGRVVLGQTDLGIPNLLAVLYDVDPGTRPEEILAGFANASTIHNPLNVLGGLGDRLFSTLTGPDGSFRVNFADNEFRIRNEEEKRPDLLLLVFAPEAPGKTLSDLIMFVSPEVRQNAGRLESYFIQLTEQQLRKAGVPAPTRAAIDSEEPDAVIQKVNLSVSRQVKINLESGAGPDRRGGR